MFPYHFLYHHFLIKEVVLLARLEINLMKFSSGNRQSSRCPCPHAAESCLRQPNKPSVTLTRQKYTKKIDVFGIFLTSSDDFWPVLRFCSLAGGSWSYSESFWTILRKVGNIRFSGWRWALIFPECITGGLFCQKCHYFFSVLLVSSVSKN